MTAIYAGSFDPVTRGHMDIISRAARVCTRLVIAVSDSPDKQPFFPLTERLRFLKRETQTLASAEVEPFSGMAAAFALEQKADVFIRGVRNAADWDYETTMARYNRGLTQGIDTWLIPADPALAHISSSAVKLTARLVYENGFDDQLLLTLVSPLVKTALQARLFANPEKR